MACAADTQCSVAFTFRPSGESPPRVSRIVGAPQLDDLAALVLHDVRARDEVGGPQPHLAARRQAEELLRRILHEVVALDVELARERHLPRAGRGILRVVDDVDLFDLPFGIVRDDDLQRPQDRHDARRAAVQVLAHAVLELRHVDDVFLLGDADPRAEIADRLRRVAAAAQTGDRRHARIVPAGDVLLLHELQQLPLAHHGVVQVQPRELDLLRPVALEQGARPASRRAAGDLRTPACRSSA